MNLYVTKPGRLSRKDHTLTFKEFQLPEGYRLSEEEAPIPDDAAVVNKHNLPIEAIDAIFLFHEIRINTKLLNFLAQKKIPVHVFNYWGHHSGTYMPHAEQLSGDLVIRQSLAFENMERRLAICRAWADAKIHNMLSILSYYNRRKKGLESEIADLQKNREALPNAKSPETIMGFEGTATRIYYSCWKHWLGETATDFLRNYHPPDNPLNAMISFLNGMLYTACVSELFRTALYPGISYLHSPQSRRYSLALDLVEPFKPLLVDRLIFRLFGRNEIGDSDFEDHSNGVLLKNDSRKRVLQAWDEQLRRTVEYPSLNRSVSYRQLLRLDCYKLIKHLLEDEPFVPYRIAY